jgi:hypothetical protein
MASYAAKISSKSSDVWGFGAAKAKPMRVAESTTEALMMIGIDGLDFRLEGDKIRGKTEDE